MKKYLKTLTIALSLSFLSIPSFAEDKMPEKKMDSMKMEECKMDHKHDEKCKMDPKKMEECKMDHKHDEKCKMDPKKMEECKKDHKHDEKCKMDPKKMEECKMHKEKGFETTIFGLPLNEGPIDRTMRVTVGLGLLGAGIYGLSTKAISPEISWSMVGVSAVPLATGASGYCPIYQLFGLKYTF
ncbi:MAG: DUF2892 domain-containing protein [Cyanobacteriota bacterium]